MWRVHIKEKHIISRWNLLWMPFVVYSAHVFNNSFGRVYRPLVILVAHDKIDCVVLLSNITWAEMDRQMDGQAA